ncbi:deoxyribose-phosphate aldolase [Thermosyntropha lipolytica DSM 11003]|uniref:Deoxyribose-phosphate aldolase n=1 Tax=Thermosyntropha lipolytica DSM 11003 TaxID=1123382 RepID=A0A1M5N9K8_9FIRM|nr:deoxyribose-phosphate aldolase [Thermosyntropha lipolytica]SHG86132.1 deoxyribose-phosphate aldolase [Thermosyntropha lipolytica DSM 11003]
MLRLAEYIDATNLKAEARAEDIEKLCLDAVKYNMAAVCVNPYRLALAASLLKGTPVKPCTVIGFPLGAETSRMKRIQAEEMLKKGALELDMVMNVGAFKDGDYELVKKEIKEVLSLKQDFSFALKVIVETALLSEEELKVVTRLVSETGADFIKTSTGFASRGVSLRDIEIIRVSKSEALKIKASGGIKGKDWALKLVEAGAERLGTSNPLAVLGL